MNIALIDGINKDLALALPENILLDELQKQLSAHINTLIQTNFEKLISILYRIDINEAKLKGLLEHNRDEDAANIITTLIIERQLEKIKLRNQFRQEPGINDEEKW